MPFAHNNGIRFYTFDIFPPTITQAVFTRQGGVSPAPWLSLNVGGTVGDEKARVLENRSRSFGAVGRNLRSLFDVWQVHSADAVFAEAPRPPEEDHHQADIIFTDKPAVTLYMRFADCVPILFYDPQKNVVGLAHAGWLGTVRGTSTSAVEAMKRRYGSKPEDVRAAIGPSIGVDHYEVGSDVIGQVQQVFGADADRLIVLRDGKTYLDLWAANRIQLEKAGIEQIEVAGLCTACHLDDWYSHRGGKRQDGTVWRFDRSISISIRVQLRCACMKARIEWGRIASMSVLTSSIRERYLRTLDIIDIAARKTGRTPESVRLVVVTKLQSVPVIRAAVEAGAQILGENYAEEAAEKIAELASSNGPSTTPAVEWHMIGHVQSRKASIVSQNFALVHSLDSLKLAERLDRCAAELGRTLSVLLEFNMSGEKTKHGWAAAEDSTWEQILPDLKAIAALSHIKIRGLMTMPPLSTDPEAGREYFRKLRRLQGFLTKRIAEAEWVELSMGTSADFAVAVEEGATLVRVGQAILGPRPNAEEA